MHWYQPFQVTVFFVYLRYIHDCLVRAKMLYLDQYCKPYSILFARITAMCGDYYIGGRQFDKMSVLIGYYTSCSDLLKDERLQYPVPPPEVRILTLYFGWTSASHVVLQA